MPKPQFRENITARLNQLPPPVPQVWRRVDNLHAVLDAGVSTVEFAHRRLRDGAVLPLASRLGASDASIEAFRRRHDRVIGRLYGSLHAAHWYL
jgi:hypothetical protein